MLYLQNNKKREKKKKKKKEENCLKKYEKYLHLCTKVTIQTHIVKDLT